jgi:hypothetical protein
LRYTVHRARDFGQGERHIMQIGVFSVSDITTDPTTGRTPTETDRIKASVAIAKKDE